MSYQKTPERPVQYKLVELNKYLSSFMTSAAENKQQQHPQWMSDRQLLTASYPGHRQTTTWLNWNSLRIRYRGFPGATDIQTDLDKVCNSGVLQKQTFIRKLVKSMLVSKSTKLEVERRDRGLELSLHGDERLWGRFLRCGAATLLNVTSGKVIGFELSLGEKMWRCQESCSPALFPHSSFQRV